MHRFFTDAPLPAPGQEFALPTPLVHQLGHVLRSRQGDRVLLLDNNGYQYEVELVAFSRGEVRGLLLAREPVQPEPGPTVTLYACLLKGERFEMVLQKATELGVAALVPVISERTIVSGAETAGKRERWGRIVREAAEQSRRGSLPTLALPLSWSAAVAQAAGHDLALVPWEEAGPGDSLGPILAAARQAGRVALLIGPEGGLTAGEVAEAVAAGIRPVSLGPRILRAETAALAVLALLLLDADQ